MKFSLEKFRTVGDVLLHPDEHGNEFIVERIRWVGKRGPSHINTERVLIKSGITIAEYMAQKLRATPRYIIHTLEKYLKKDEKKA